ncbi:hypothetical protein [Glycomyces arizonensis]|uniref:hypothetical protein n=1 Tax=Glycomyces arizonensis TaxID=256035 RepID=UPI0012EB2FAF|nr:hypothetical protein [Glycomyces arizonensis]
MGFTTDWKYRRLDAERDGAALLGEHVLQQGESVKWMSAEGIDGYLMEGRKQDGTFLDKPAETRKTVLKWIARPVVFLMAIMLDGDPSFDQGFRMRTPPRAVVFGSEVHCMSVYNPYTPLPKAGEGVWALTDRRFARVRLDPVLEGAERLQLVRRGDHPLPLEPVECALEYEVPASSVRCHRGVEREFKRGFRTKRAMYDNVTLLDGSGFDFLSDRR